MRRLSIQSTVVEQYGSVGVGIAGFASADRPVETFRVHIATYEAGSLLGRHPAGLWQLLGIVSGAGWAEGADGERVDLGRGDAVLWAPGEEHASGSSAGMVAVIVQSRVPPLPLD